MLCHNAENSNKHMHFKELEDAGTIGTNIQYFDLEEHFDKSHLKQILECSMEKIVVQVITTWLQRAIQEANYLDTFQAKFRIRPGIETLLVSLMNYIRILNVECDAF